MTPPAVTRRQINALPATVLAAQGRLHSVETCGTVDGPGIRTILFLQGCLLQCRFCHNPDSWDRRKGRPISVAQALDEIIPYQSFHQSSGGGVTLSGGDPLAQPDFSRALLDACRSLGIHTALDTAGGIPLERSQPVLEAADLVLLDLKHSDPDGHQWLTGVPQARPLATGDYLAEHGKPVWVRTLLVPGITDHDAHIHWLADTINRWPNVERVDVLGYHTMALPKWERLGKISPLVDTPPTSDAVLQRARQVLSDAGCPVSGLAP